MGAIFSTRGRRRDGINPDAVRSHLRYGIQQTKGMGSASLVSCNWREETFGKSPAGLCLVRRLRPRRTADLRPLVTKPTKVEASPKYDPGRWVNEHGGCLYGYALARVRVPEVARDLVQETFLVGIRSLERFAGRSSERSWLVGILKNKILDYWRKAHREMPFSDIEFRADQGSESFDRHSSCLNVADQWGSKAEEVLHKTEFWQIVHDCLSKLPRRHSVVFTLREIDSMSTKEICRTLSISEANLWVMLHRARAALRESLEENWFGQ
jgi:RNA polymerase sigma-70 factor (TIGR02943 family)